MSEALITVGTVIESRNVRYVREVIAIMGDIVYARDEFGTVYRMDRPSIRREWNAREGD